MFSKNHRYCALATCLIGMSSISPAVAQLPSLNEKLWLGHFLGLESRNFNFGVTSEGAAEMKIIGKKDEPLGSHSALKISFIVEETFPDGRTSQRRILPESLESDQPASLKIDDVVIRGKVTGDAGFEIFLTENRGTISLGGRITDPGSLTKNPLRFKIEAKFDDLYRYSKQDGDKKALKEFEEKTKNDRMQLVLADKKRIKHTPGDPVNATELSGPGVTALQMEISTYQGKKFEFLASENSSMMLVNKDSKPLHSGFSILWTADTAKDPEAKARFSIEAK